MKRDSRLSGVLHVLMHLSAASKPLTSEELAKAMHTNPVVVRRTMAGLREAGLVRSEKGHGGGWSVARDLEAMTLYDVYAAIGAPTPFALGNRTESPGCLVEQVVNESLDDAFKEAETILMARLRTVSLAALAVQFKHRLTAHNEHQGECVYDV
ncbi:MAG: Rrf2 family transcriptional regulator [Chloroflexi bacterium]|nr:Rrf2 family transcriptional regulator [Chloroflexota bacterium]